MASAMPKEVAFRWALAPEVRPRCGAAALPDLASGTASTAAWPDGNLPPSTPLHPPASVPLLSPAIVLLSASAPSCSSVSFPSAASSRRLTLGDISILDKRGHYHFGSTSRGQTSFFFALNCD